ncbi:hypothetical protein CEXT_661421 [Caerostris extrusa]|uniref:Uncharacterized protein n=1 Tax=Caerostris extrusa TaxID=172846 RepID=A0AAV4XBG6_CAEEX|nr:hypothetical protein CEXT_661421 [Caerostris extrusa]
MLFVFNIFRIIDAEEHKGLEDCFETLNDEDIQMVLDWLDSDYKSSDYTGKFHAIDVLYCQTDTITRKDRFRIASQGTLDITSSLICEGAGSAVLKDTVKSCVNDGANVLECTVGVVEDLKEKKKCDIKEFEESGLQMKKDKLVCRKGSTSTINKIIYKILRKNKQM